MIRERTLDRIECPRCKGAGTIEVVLYCECGHDRSEHLPGFGCMACSAYYSDQCDRFKAATT